MSSSPAPWTSKRNSLRRRRRPSAKDEAPGSDRVWSKSSSRWAASASSAAVHGHGQSGGGGGGGGCPKAAELVTKSKKLARKPCIGGAESASESLWREKPERPAAPDAGTDAEKEPDAEIEPSAECVPEAGLKSEGDPVGAGVAAAVTEPAPAPAPTEIAGRWRKRMDGAGKLLPQATIEVDTPVCSSAPVESQTEAALQLQQDPWSQPLQWRQHLQHGHEEERRKQRELHQKQKQLPPQQEWHRGDDREWPHQDERPWKPQDPKQWRGHSEPQQQHQWWSQEEEEEEEEEEEQHEWHSRDGQPWRSQDEWRSRPFRRCWRWYARMLVRNDEKADSNHKSCDKDEKEPQNEAFAVPMEDVAVSSLAPAEAKECIGPEQTAGLPTGAQGEAVPVLVPERKVARKRARRPFNPPQDYSRRPDPYPVKPPPVEQKRKQGANKITYRSDLPRSDKIVYQ